LGLASDLLRTGPEPCAGIYAPSRKARGFGRFRARRWPFRSAPPVRNRRAHAGTGRVQAADVAHGPHRKQGDHRRDVLVITRAGVR